MVFGLSEKERIEHKIKKIHKKALLFKEKNKKINKLKIFLRDKCDKDGILKNGTSNQNKELWTQIELLKEELPKQKKAIEYFCEGIKKNVIELIEHTKNLQNDDPLRKIAIGSKEILVLSHDYLEDIAKVISKEEEELNSFNGQDLSKFLGWFKTEVRYYLLISKETHHKINEMKQYFEAKVALADEKKITTVYPSVAVGSLFVMVIGTLVDQHFGADILGSIFYDKESIVMYGLVFHLFMALFTGSIGFYRFFNSKLEEAEKEMNIAINALG